MRVTHERRVLQVTLGFWQHRSRFPARLDRPSLRRPSEEIALAVSDYDRPNRILSVTKARVDGKDCTKTHEDPRIKLCRRAVAVIERQLRSEGAPQSDSRANSDGAMRRKKRRFGTRTPLRHRPTTRARSNPQPQPVCQLPRLPARRALRCEPTKRAGPRAIWHPRHLRIAQVLQTIGEIMAERTGLEPATPGVTGRYSNQLNYRSGWGGECYPNAESTIKLFCQSGSRRVPASLRQ